MPTGPKEPEDKDQHAAAQPVPHPLMPITGSISLIPSQRPCRPGISSLVIVTPIMHYNRLASPAADEFATIIVRATPPP